MTTRPLHLFEWLHHHSPRLFQAVAMLVVATGIGLWGALLLAPKPTAAPPMLALNAAPDQNIEAIANWFGGGSARLRISVVGLISGQHGAALLSINGKPPLAYRVGQPLAQGVTLAAVLPHAVAIDQDGMVEEISMPKQIVPAQGFMPASL